MKQSSGARFLMEFAKDLRSREALPKNIELSTIGPVVMASVFDKSSAVITDEVTTGMDTDPDVAVLKGLVERIERQAFVNGRDMNNSVCMTSSSDGFAAFPSQFRNAAKHARDNAYHEAVERFVWANWWDDTSIGHKLESVNYQNPSFPSQKLLTELSDKVPLKSVHRILPHIANADDICVSIYFAFLDPIGVISGGAAGPINDIEVTNFRAICELLRHGLAMKKLRDENIKTETFYENRLAYFGSTPEGTSAAANRLSISGPKSVRLPKLMFDEMVPHELSDLVKVHRCLFENQPPFIGGTLERLCL